LVLNLMVNGMFPATVNGYKLVFEELPAETTNL
jgi:hypothetical protein